MVKVAVNKKLGWLIVLLALMPLNMAFAKDYLIEIIVFSQPSNSESQELWNNDKTLKKERDSTLKSPRSGAGAPEYFTPVLLSNAAAAIRRKPGFELLSHIAWRQSGAPRNDSPIVRLPRNNSSADLEGWMRIYLNTFIYAELDLTMNNDQVGFNTRALTNNPSNGNPSNNNLSNNNLSNNNNGVAAPFGNSPSSQYGNVFSNAPFRLKNEGGLNFAIFTISITHA